MQADYTLWRLIKISGNSADPLNSLNWDDSIFGFSWMETRVFEVLYCQSVSGKMCNGSVHLESYWYMKKGDNVNADVECRCLSKAISQQMSLSDVNLVVF